MEVTITGMLVSVFHTEYQTFKADDGSMIPAGSNNWAYLVADAESRPQAVKLTNQAEATQFAKAVGTVLTVPCTVSARDDEIVLRSMGTAKPA